MVSLKLLFFEFYVRIWNMNILNSNENYAFNIYYTLRPLVFSSYTVIFICFLFIRWRALFKTIANNSKLFSFFDYLYEMHIVDR